MSLLVKSPTPYALVPAPVPFALEVQGHRGESPCADRWRPVRLTYRLNGQPVDEIRWVHGILFVRYAAPPANT